MNHYERKGAFCRRPWLALPLQIGLLGFCLIFATPLACAVFKQNAELRFNQLEQELRVLILLLFKNRNASCFVSGPAEQEIQLQTTSNSILQQGIVTRFVLYQVPGLCSYHRFGFCSNHKENIT